MLRVGLLMLQGSAVSMALWRNPQKTTGHKTELEWKQTYVWYERNKKTRNTEHMYIVCRMTSLQWLKSQHDIACKDWRFSRWSRYQPLNKTPSTCKYNNHLDGKKQAGWWVDGFSAAMLRISFPRQSMGAFHFPNIKVGITQNTIRQLNSETEICVHKLKPTLANLNPSQQVV